MAEINEVTLHTTKVADNEIVRADDFNFAFESMIENINIFSKLIFDCQKDFIIGGKIIPDTGTNVKVQPIFGVCSSTKIPFGIASTSSVAVALPISSNAYKAIIQARGEWLEYDEQQRGFNDLMTNTITYQNVNTKKYLNIIYDVKFSGANSQTAPTKDEGCVKIAEIHIPANTVTITQDMIKNITADTAELNNDNWTTEQDSTYNIGYLGDVNKKFRVDHNPDGTHKNNIIHVAQLDIGQGTNQINASKIPVTSANTIGNTSNNIDDNINTVLVKVAAQITNLYNSYLKYGKYNFDGALSLGTPQDSSITNKITFEAATESNKSVLKIKFCDDEVMKLKSDGSLIINNQNMATQSSITNLQTQITNYDTRFTTIESNISKTDEKVNTLLNKMNVSTVSIDHLITTNISKTNNQLKVTDNNYKSKTLLLVGQTDKKENGIYLSTSDGVLSRSSNFNSNNQMSKLFFTIGSTDTTNKNKIYFLKQDTYTLGTTELDFLEAKISIEPAANKLVMFDNQSNIHASKFIGQVGDTSSKSSIYATTINSGNITSSGTVSASSGFTGKISALKENSTMKNFNFTVSGNTLTITTSN